MPKLISNKGEIVDHWQVFDPISETLANAGDFNLVFPTSYWVEHRSDILQQTSDSETKLGVCLSSDQAPSLIAEDLERLDLIAIEFPVFADGRGYSYAKTLRKEYNFKGEIRAIGDILIDQLAYLERCGFDSFALRDDQDLATALESFEAFSESYQAEFDREALFNRR